MVMLFTSWSLACTVTTLVQAHALALPDDRAHVQVHWISPVSGSNYGPGAKIVASWSTANPRSSNAWAVQLCFSGSDHDGRSLTCGATVWMDVERRGDIYQVSLHAPEVTYKSSAFILLKNEHEESFRSPAFTLDEQPSRADDLSDGEGAKNMAVQAVFTTTTTVHVASSSVSALSETSTIHPANTSSNLNSTSPSHRVNLVNGAPNISLALAISLPLGILGIALLVSALMCALRERPRKRKEAPEKRDGPKGIKGVRAGMRKRGKSFRIGSDAELGAQVDSAAAPQPSSSQRDESGKAPAPPSPSSQSPLSPSSVSTDINARHLAPHNSFSSEYRHHLHPHDPSARTQQSNRKKRTTGVMFEEVGRNNQRRWTAPNCDVVVDDVKRRPSVRPPTPFTSDVETPSDDPSQNSTPNNSRDNLLTERTTDKDTNSDSSAEIKSTTTFGTLKGRPTAAVTDTVLSRYLAPSPMLSPMISQTSAYSTTTKDSLAGASSRPLTSSGTVKALRKPESRDGAEADSESGNDSDTGTITARTFAVPLRGRPEPHREHSTTEASVLDEEDQIVISRAMFESDVSAPLSPVVSQSHSH